MDEISFHIDNVKVPGHNPEFLRLWIDHVVTEENRRLGKLAYIFCSDEYLLAINKQYLNHDYYTDIITFNYNDKDISGDIFISVDTVKSNSDKYSKGDFNKELNRVIIHGVLHLCGYDDKTEEDQKRMTEKENWALEEMARFT